MDTRGVAISISDVKNWSLSDEDLNIIREQADLFRYQGLDPRHILELLLKRAGKRNFKSDMLKIATWIATRGVKIGDRDKAFVKTSKNGQAMLMELRNVYGILTTGTTKFYGADDITLPRISAVIPHLIAFINERATYARLVGYLESGIVPISLCFPAGVSLIPKKETEMFDAWLKWAINFDQVIKRGAGDPVAVTKFAHIAWDSPMFDEDQRISIISKLKKRKDSIEQVSQDEQVRHSAPNRASATDTTVRQ